MPLDAKGQPASALVGPQVPGLLDLLVEDDLNQALVISGDPVRDGLPSMLRVCLLVISGDPRLNTNGTTRSSVNSILARVPPAPLNIPREVCRPW
jgi:hypothetical protein